MRTADFVLMTGLAAVAAILLLKKSDEMTDAANAGYISANAPQSNLSTSKGQPMNMQLSPAGLSAIQAREGFSATKYPDATGYSIGYGHFILPGEDFPDGVSQAQALLLLAGDVGFAVDCVNATISADLTQNQFDALVSFTYNVGKGAFAGSTLAHKVNTGDATASDEFGKWIYSKVDGVETVNQALVNRRASETAQFTS